MDGILSILEASPINIRMHTTESHPQFKYKNHMYRNLKSQFIYSNRNTLQTNLHFAQSLEITP